MSSSENITKSLDRELEKLWNGIDYAGRHPKNVLNEWNEKETPGIPEIIPAPNDEGSRLITIEARDALYEWIRRQYESDQSLKSNLSLEEWEKHVRLNILKFLSQEAENAAQDDNPEEAAKQVNRNFKYKLKKYAKENIPSTLTHIYAFSYARSPLTQYCDLGCMNLIPPKNIEEEIDKFFKESPHDKNEFSKSVYKENIDVINDWKKDATCFVSISVGGLGTTYSNQWASTAARLTLTALLLPLGIETIRRAHFLDEPIKPKRQVSLKFRGDNHPLSHFSINPPTIPNGDYILDNDPKYQAYRATISKLLTAYIAPSSCSPDIWKHPNLAILWLSSLHWFRLAVKSEFDFESVVHLGVSLDVLTAGTKEIENLCTCLFDIEPDYIIFRAFNQKSLKSFIKELYSSGRSNIVHGTREGLRENLTTLRNRAENFVWHTLNLYIDNLIYYESTTRNDTFQSFLEYLKKQ